MKRRKRRSKAELAVSRLSPHARAILAHTKAAQAKIDERIAGVVLEGGPPELGPKRETSTPRWLERDIVPMIRNGRRRGADHGA